MLHSMPLLDQVPTGLHWVSFTKCGEVPNGFDMRFSLEKKDQRMFYKFLGESINNRSEMDALLEGIKLSLELSFQNLQLRSGQQLQNHHQTNPE